MSYPCRRCDRDSVEKWGLCSVCLDWWEEKLGHPIGEGVPWLSPENTTQQSLGEYE